MMRMPTNKTLREEAAREMCALVLEPGERLESLDFGDIEIIALTLIECVVGEDWDRFHAVLPQLQRLWTLNGFPSNWRTDTNRGERVQSPYSFRNLLATACSNPRVPVDVVQSVLRLDPQAAALPDELDHRTALHIVVERSDRTDLVQSLVDAAPFCVQVRDDEGLRPIDILTQKIIMIEERIRYLGKRNDNDQELLDNWESARALVTAHAKSKRNRLVERKEQLSQQTRFLHCYLQATDVPLSLIERAIRRYEFELALPDAEGNLPLHHIAARLPTDDADDLLPDILSNYPKAASTRNRCGQWPFNIALQAGREWDSGLSLLLDSFPGALENLDFTPTSIPLIIREFQRRGRSWLIFVLLRLNPGAVMTKKSLRVVGDNRS